MFDSQKPVVTAKVIIMHALANTANKNTSSWLQPIGHRVLYQHHKPSPALLIW